MTTGSGQKRLKNVSTLTQHRNLHPRILLSATLLPTATTISLSQASPTSPPITLHLQVRLTESPIPITVLLPFSALDPRTQSLYRSYHHLTSQTTGERPRQMTLHALLGPRTMIKDPENELLTLYPDAPPTEISIPIGIHASPRYQERERRRRGYAALSRDCCYVAGGVGGRGEVRGGLKEEIGGEFPGYVLWWDSGEKEE